MKIRRPPVAPPRSSSTRATASTAVAPRGVSSTLAPASLLPPSSHRAALGAATVIGGGPAGLAQALLLLKRADETGLKRLTVVERRDSYARPVGLFFRSITLDALAWLDDESFRELERRAGLRDDNGKIVGLVAEGIDPEGNVVRKVLRPRGDVSARRFEKTALDRARPIAEIADELFANSSCSLITMKDLEEVLWDALPRIARAHGVTLDARRGWEASLSVDDDGKASVVLCELHKDPASGRPSPTGKKDALPEQGLVVLTEGASARVRGQLADIAVQATGPAEKIVAAGLQGAPQPTGPSLRSGMCEWVDDAGETHPVRVMRGTNAGNGLVWTVCGVPDGVTFDATDENRFARDVNAWFDRYAGLAGDIELPTTFGPSLGQVKGTLVYHAVRADNLVLCGDVVGTSHFSAGGGAATAITTHVAAMNRFLDDVAAGAPRILALKQLDVDLRTASLTWALYGLPEFTGDPWELRQQHLPRELLEELLPAHFVERYWPASGGAPTDEKSPWTPWFERAIPRDASAHLAAADAARSRPPQCTLPLKPEAWGSIFDAAQTASVPASSP